MRRPNQFLQDKVVLDAGTVAAVAATTSFALGVADGDFTLDRFEIVSPAAYTSDAANYYDISCQLTPITFTAVAATDVCTAATHGFLTGDAVQVTTSNALPAGLVISTTYYVIKIDANTFKLATTPSNAAAGTAIDITNTGTGVQSVAKILAMYSLKTTTGNGDLVANIFAAATLQPNPTGLSGQQLNMVLTKLGTGANVAAGTRSNAKLHQL
jgi:hypothetical protein